MTTSSIKNYKPLLYAAGFGSVLGSGIIVSLASTITVWQSALVLNDAQVGTISGALTFAIALGSLLTGQITKIFGLRKTFDWMNVVFLAGAALCMAASSYWMLLAGAILAGFASGCDLPVSLTMLSHDAPNEKISAELVSGSQVYWTIGILLSTLIAFVTSGLGGAWSARIAMGVLCLIALVTIYYRTKNKAVQKIHANAPDETSTASNTKQASVFQVLFKDHSKPYLAFLICILFFYCGWNLLANTFGQFQTFMLVKANASQTLATGCGVVLTLVCLVIAQLFSKIAGGKYRNIAFGIGIIVMIAALVGLANSGTSILLIVLCLAFQNVGSTLAGEAMYKVWTQESFPSSVRSGIQGFINGTSRLLCAAFAVITPTLVLPENIYMTMMGFAGLIAAAGVAGFIQIRLQKKHNVGTTTNNAADLADLEQIAEIH